MILIDGWTVPVKAKKAQRSVSKRITKRTMLPCMTWPLYHALRCFGYYHHTGKPAHIERVLLALYGGIGNVVLASPMLQAIHEELPDASLDVWCQASVAAEICQAVPYVNQVLTGEVDRLSGDYDLFIANCVAPPLRASLFGLRCGASIRAGEDPTRSHRGCLFNCQPSSDPALHEVNRNLAILRAIGFEPRATKPFVCLDEKHRDVGCGILHEIRNSDKPLVGIHAGSGAYQPFKRWPRERFAELTLRLEEDCNAMVLLFGGPDEAGLAEAIAAQSAHGSVVAGRLSLLETAALIEQCDLFISNDSALMHIAAAMDTCTIGIFGPTRPGKNRPYGQGHAVVQAGMECQPCYNVEGTIRCAAPVSCLKAVTVEHVLHVARKRLLEKWPVRVPVSCDLGCA